MTSLSPVWVFLGKGKPFHFGDEPHHHGFKTRFPILLANREDSTVTCHSAEFPQLQIPLGPFRSSPISFQTGGFELMRSRDS